MKTLLLLLIGLLLPSTTIESEGKRWTYYTSAPPGQPRNLPLVVLFHGTGGSGGGFLDKSGWADKARSEGFVCVAPSGQAKDPEQPPDFQFNPRQWNNNKVFALDLLGDVLSHYHCDTHRIYLIGHSNGANFCYQLASAYPQRFAAIAAVAGPTEPVLKPLTRPVPTYAIFGTEDPIIPLQGGTAITPWGSRQFRPVPEMMTLWAQALGFSGAPQTTLDDENQKTETWGPNLQVTYLKGHGHNYPVSSMPLVDPRFGPVRCEIPVNEQIWEFFKTRETP